MQRRTLLRAVGAVLTCGLGAAFGVTPAGAGQAGTGQAGKDPRYPATGPGHFVKENREGGRFLVLEDKSVWEIAPANRYRSVEWQELEGISIRFADGDPPYSYEMTNTDRDEGVAARWVRPES